jgi:4-hydroxybenzoate polyprenyltransferase
MVGPGSSSTSSRTSTRSSTSDAASAPGPGARVAALVRLVHPFPSILDGVVVAAVAVVAGASAVDASRLGLAMTALQFGIGATNDIVDAPRDAGHKPRKPIPAGLVSRPVARVVAVAGFALGIVLSAPSGPPTAALAVTVAGIGLAYDLRLKGTAWSWLPFAVGIPILPVFGWLGTTGTLPPVFGILVPVAVVAGAALAIANALADIERDRAAGTVSVATALGAGRAWAVQAGLIGVVVGAALTSAALLAAPAGRLLLVAIAGFVPVAGLAFGRGGGADRLERAWQLEAVGVAALGLAWIWAFFGWRDLG